MAACLAEGVQFGLSSHGISSENKSLVFVKLTDSSAKAIEEYLKIKLKTTQHPSIQFCGNEGRLWFPTGEEGRGSAFSFSLSSAAEIGGPQGSFECVQQCGSRSLESHGLMALKMSIKAKDDVYEATRQRMAVAEEESKKNCTRVIKSSGPDIGRKVKVRKPPGSVVFPARKDRSDSPPPYSAPSRGGSGGNYPSSLHSLSAPNHSSVHNYNSTSNGRSTTSSPSLGGSNGVGRPTSNAISPLPRSAASPSYSTAPTSNTSSSNVLKDGLTNSASGANSGTEANPELMRRPLRERIIHLLAIRPYKKPELMGRLHKEGLKEKDRKVIMPVLNAVALMKDQAYHLARHIWSEVVDDWQFYTDQEKQILKRRKPQNLTPPGSDSSSGSGHSPPSSSLQSSSSGSPTTTGSSSAVIPKTSPSASGGVKRPSPQESPNHSAGIGGGGSLADSAAATAAKKQRISHYKKPDSSQPHSTMQPDSRNAQPVVTGTYLGSAPGSGGKTSLKIRPSPPNSSSASANTTHQNSSTVANHRSSSSSHHHNPNNYFRPAGHPHHSSSAQVSTRVTSSTDGPDTPNSSPDSLTDTMMETETPLTTFPEFTHQYRRIVSGEQRSRYKEDFNSQYKEYRDLHKAIFKVSKRFAQLEEELKQESEGTLAWQRIKNQIVREYKENMRDMKFQEAKRRFEHLHEKLAHIKRLVLEWDTAQAQQQLSSCRS